MMLQIEKFGGWEERNHHLHARAHTYTHIYRARHTHGPQVENPEKIRAKMLRHKFNILLELAN
jgi:hypothetical protein